MDIKTSTQIADAFLRLWRDSRERTSRFEETTKGPHRLFSEPDKGTILTGPKGIVAFEKIVTLLSEDPAIGMKFSRRELEKQIQSVAVILHGVKQSDIEMRVNSHVKAMIQQLEGSTPARWEIYLPVENLVLDSEVTIGQTSIKMCDDSIRQSILNTFVKMNRLSTSPDEVKNGVEKIFEERLAQDYTGRAIMRVETRAVDAIRAVELAIEQAETALNVLRFYSRGVIEYDARHYRMYIGLKGSTSRGQLFAVGFREPAGHTMSVQNTGYLYELKLGEKELSQMQKDSFKTLHEILFKAPDQRTAFENLIVNSVNLFGGAMNNQDRVGALVSIVVSLESILLRKGEPMRTLLAERIALLLGRNYEERMFYFSQMSRLYQIRSDIVHRGFQDITDSDLFLLSIIAYHVLVKLIADSPKLNDIGKLVEAFNTMKFGGTGPEK